jgi:hypothetical protein
MCSSPRTTQCLADSSWCTSRTELRSWGTGSQSMSPDGALQLQPCATCAGSRPRVTGSDGYEPLPPTPTQHRSGCCSTPASLRPGQPIHQTLAESRAPGISGTSSTCHRLTLETGVWHACTKGGELASSDVRLSASIDAGYGEPIRASCHADHPILHRATDNASPAFLLIGQDHRPWPWRDGFADESISDRQV